MSISDGTAFASMEERDFAKTVALLNFAVEKCADFISVDELKLQSILDKWNKDMEGPHKETFLETFYIVGQIEQKSYDKFPKIYCKVSLPVLQESLGDRNPIVLKAE